MAEKKTSDMEERYISAVHVAGIYLGVFVMATASILAFVLALARLIGAFFFLFDINSGLVNRSLSAFGVEEKPIILMLVDIVDASLIAAILLIFAFGLKSVFLGRRYRVVAFDIRDIDELKEYLIGLVITLMGTRFLERMLRVGIGPDIFGIGIGVAAVIFALGAYDFILKQRKRTGE